MNSRTLALVIAAYNKSKPVFRTVKTAMEGTARIGVKSAKAISTAYKKLSTAVKAVGNAMKAAFKLALIPFTVLSLGFGLAVREAAAFEQAMANVASVLGSDREEMARLSKAAREMGKTSVFNAMEAAEAMYHLGSAGFSADQIIASLKGTMLLAAATASDLAYTTASVVATINQFDLKAGDADRVANAFAASISFSTLNMDKLTTAMTYAGPVASGFGHSLEGTIAVLAQFSNMGYQASQIGTIYRMGLMQLQRVIGNVVEEQQSRKIAEASAQLNKLTGALGQLAQAAPPLQSASEVLKKIRVNFTDIDPATHSVSDIVKVLHGRVKTLSQAMSLFGRDAGRRFYEAIKAGESGAMKLGSEMEKLKKETMPAVDIFTRLGVTAEELDPSRNSVADIVEKLHGKVTTMKDAVELFNVRAAGAFLKLIKAGDTPIREFEKRITGTRKAFKMSDIQITTFYGSLRLFRSAMKELATNLGMAFLPILASVVDKFAAWTNILNKVDFSQVFKGLSENASTGVKAFDKILDMFREGGAFRVAIREWIVWFIDVVSGVARIIWRPIETEIGLAMMRMMKTVTEKLGKTWIGRRLGFNVTQAGKYGELAQQRYKLSQQSMMSGDVKKLFSLLGSGVKVPTERTTEALTQLADVLSGMTTGTASKKVVESSSAFVRKLEAFIDKNEAAMEQLNENQVGQRKRLEMHIARLQAQIDKWKMQHSTQVSAVGALQ